LYAALVAAPAAAADAPRGVQFSSDGRFTFVNKDVGGQRYAIIREEDGTVTGNVFFTDCRTPKFIVCEPLEGANEYACSISNACAQEPCEFDEGEPVNVTLPADFFEPPGPAPAAATAVNETCLQPRAIQMSADGERLFINKDVEGQRYAITLFDADDTLTGNVFVGPDVPPKFIACEHISGSQTRRFACEVADPCPPTPEPCTFGGFSTVVTLESDFFEFDARETQTVNTFSVTNAITNTLRIGVGAIPSSAAAGETGTQAEGVAIACPGGGTVEFTEDTIAYDACHVGNIVCTGGGEASGGHLTPVLQCTDLNTDRVFDLAVDVSLMSTAAGEALDGLAITGVGGNPGLELAYDLVSLGTTEFGDAQSGMLTIDQVKSFFPGFFNRFEYPFDGSNVVKIVAFLPTTGGFFVLVFDLDLTTGKLTAR
jgi:hypothetical protein